jgi:hypothetical protein
MAKHAHNTGGGNPLPFDLIDLDMLKPGQRDLDKIYTRGFTMWGGAVSIVKDVIRGVPA